MTIETRLFTDSGVTQGGDAAIAPAADGSQSQQNLFTTLLVAQIRNQNPLEPTDPSDFVAQLTQLSQMEALQKLATQSAANTSLFQSLQTLGLGAQVGTEVSVRSDRVSLDGSTPVEGRFELTSSSARNTVVLRGAGGIEHRVELGTLPIGEVNFEIDPIAHAIPAGNYSIEIECASQETPPIDINGLLRSLRMSAAGQPVLNVSSVGETSIDSITAFNGPRAN